MDVANFRPVEYCQPPESSLEPLAELAVFEGLGSTIAKLYASPEYHAYAAHYRNINTGSIAFTPAQQWAIARGVHLAGNMLTLDYSLEPNDQHEMPPEAQNPEDLALVATLGRKLIDHLRHNLPEEAQGLAAAWRAGSKEDREEIIGEARKLFSYDTWLEAHPDCNEENETNELGQRNMHYGEPLPNNYMNWPHGKRSNCLGLSLLLCAFAEACDTPYLYINQVRGRRETVWEITDDILRTAQEYLAESGDTLLPDDANKLSRNLEKATEVNAEVMDFHHAIVMESSPGMWIILDPYLHTGSYMNGRNWKLDQTYSLLTGIGTVMPGITITQRDTSMLDRFHENIKLRLDKAATAARALRSHLNQHGYEAGTITDAAQLEEILDTFRKERLPAIADGDGLITDAYAESFWLCQAVDLPKQLADLDLPFWDDPVPEMEEQAKEAAIDILTRGMDAFDNDPVYRQAAIERVIAAPYSYSLLIYWEQVDESITTGDSIPDSALEFALPAFMSGAMVLNHLRAWSGYGNKYQGSRLARLSSSQVLWHEAMQADEPPVDSVLKRMTRLLKKWPSPWLHPRVDLRLVSLPDNREEPPRGPSKVTP